MHGIGSFDDDRLSNAKQFPVAARAGFAHVRNKRDLITAKLGPLHLYQLSLPVPHSQRFDHAAARRGRAILNTTSSRVARPRSAIERRHCAGSSPR